MTDRQAPASTVVTDAKLPVRLLQRSAVVVAAHPDDEALGLGTALPKMRSLRAIVHVTDGAPRSGTDARDAGMSSWREYASLRRKEFETAMRMTGVGARQICLRYPDQGASFRLASLSRRLARLFEWLRPALVFTHPYEGGHPDHDACAAAVRFAVSLLRVRRRPEIFEFASYHASSTYGLEPECFIPEPGNVWRRPLDEEQRSEKRKLLAYYGSQQRVLSQFPLRQEPLRAAPEYDFMKAPHKGRLFYENYNWGVTGRSWRRLARRAMGTLGLRLFR